MNADDRLPLASLGRVQGGDGVVEGRPRDWLPQMCKKVTQITENAALPQYIPRAFLPRADEVTE